MYSFSIRFSKTSEAVKGGGGGVKGVGQGGKCQGLGEFTLDI